MTDRRGIEDLKALGAGRPAPEAVVALYRQAFEDYGVRALWSRTPSAHPTIAQALVVARGLRTEGDMRARPWRRGSRTPAVPLSRLQSRILLALAAHRNPES